MKQLDLPFKIDKQHENWQFELDALDDRLSGYHSYRYIGNKLNFFLNFSTYKTELIFNGDILTAVIIIIKNADTTQLSIINQFMGFNASKESIIDEWSRRFKIWRIVYCTTFEARKKEIQIIYGKPRFINKNYVFLLDF